MATTKPFISYDYEDLLAGYIAFLKNQTTFKDYNFEGSGMKEILRLLAYDTQQRAFQNNFISNELNLGTSSIRENAVSIAANLGYVSTGRAAAKMTVAVTVTTKDIPESNTLTLRKDVKFFSNLDGKVLFFSPDKEYTSVFNDGKFVFPEVQLLQGVWVFSAFTANSNNVIESFVIPNKGIDVSTLSVQVRPNESSTTYEVYKRFESAYDLGQEERIFFTRENRKAYFEIEFGDGRFAKKLSYGNLVLAEYLVTDGSDGNNISVVVPASGVDNYFDVQVSTTQKSYMGADEESIESIKRSAPISSATQGSAVSIKDYEGIVRQRFQGVKDVIAWGGEDNIPSRTGTVFVSVVYSGQDALSVTQKNDIKTSLKKNNVGTILVDVVDAQYTYLNITSKVRFNPNQTLLTDTNIQQKVQNNLILYSGNQLEKFGDYFDKSKLVEFVNNIDPSIRGNVTSVVFEKRFIPTLNFAGTYTFRFQAGISPASVLISGFWIDSTELFGTETFSIMDNGLGGLYIYKKNLTSGVESVVSKIGDVDYETGTIDLISFSPSVILGYVAVEAKALSGDESIAATGQEIFKINKTMISGIKTYD